MRDAASSVIALRPFVPASDFEASKLFYADLGFRVFPLGEGLAEATLGEHTFLLQKFSAEGFAGNFMMHMLVNDVATWWEKVSTLGLGKKYGVKEPGPPKDEPWGLTVLYLVDPSGVLWHITQRTG